MPSLILWPNIERLDGQLLDTKEIGILTDADGTLSEIQEVPQEAFVSEAMSTLLGSLDHLYGLTAVVSGRRARDVQKLVGEETLLYLGNHGLERCQGEDVRTTSLGSSALEAVAGAKAELSVRLPKVPGMHFEDKESVLGVHYRQCTDSAAIDSVTELMEQLAGKFGLRVQHGRKISEVRPMAANKGRAVLEVAREYGVKQVIYLGDDTTDIDVFDALKEASGRGEVNGIAIAVAGPESDPGLVESADYHVASVDEVGRFFSWLVDRASL